MYDDYYDKALWSTTNTSIGILIGSVGCDPSCDVCNGPSNFECSSCSSGQYLYKGRCLSKCENDQGSSTIVFKTNSYVLDYYKCNRECEPGYYLDESLGLCFECHYQCGTCSSGRPKSCTKCKGTYVQDKSGYNYMNLVTF